MTDTTHVSLKLFDILFESHQNNQKLVIKHDNGDLTKKLKPRKGESRSVVVYPKGIDSSLDSPGINPGLETLGIAFDVALGVVRGRSAKKKCAATVFRPRVC